MERATGMTSLRIRTSFSPLTVRKLAAPRCPTSDAVLPRTTVKRVVHGAAAPAVRVKLLQGHRRAVVSVRAAAAAGILSADPGPPPQGLFVKKVAALGLIFLGSTINYTMLQSMRDAIIVTSCGAEALPFISAFGVLPASLAFFVYYDKIVAALDPKKVFYAALAPLVTFYAFYAGFLLPNADWLQPTAQLASWTASLPDSLSCFVKVAVNWTATLFFIMSELWGSVVISLLFWSLADDVCNVSEAKDVYPKLGILANFGLIAAGAYTRWVNQGPAKGNETLGLQVLIATILALTAVMCAAKSYIDTNVAPWSGEGAGKKKKKKKDKGGEKKDTWAILRGSTRIRDLTILVMAYGVTQKLFGFVWKGQMKRLYPSTAEFTTVMGDVASVTGMVTIGLMLVSKYIFTFVGWRGAALVTPLVMGVAGVIFLVGSIVAPGTLETGTLAAVLLGLGPAAGIATQVMGRASKYSLFDPSKEMVFIAMPKEEKEAGKAAVDLLGNQIGKSGGSWVMQGGRGACPGAGARLLVFGSMTGALPFTALVYLGVCLAWTNSTLSLAKTMEGAEEGKKVLATVDDAPAFSPPQPALQGIIITSTLPPSEFAKAAAGVPGDGAYTLEGDAAAVAAAEAAAEAMSTQEKEAKVSMQSHFE